MTDEIDPRILRAAVDLTWDLRISPQPRWKALRERLKAEGVIPTDAAVGNLYPDDVRLLMGLIAVRDGGIFEFALDW